MEEIYYEPMDVSDKTVLEIVGETVCLSCHGVGDKIIHINEPPEICVSCFGTGQLFLARDITIKPASFEIVNDRLFTVTVKNAD